MITVDRKEFSHALDLAATVVQRCNTIPILSTIKATANGSLTLESCDLGRFARVEMAYDGDEGEFVIAEPRGLRSAINAAGATETTLTKQDKRLAVSCGAFDASLTTMAADDHPAMERVQDERFGCDISATELRQIARVVPAISREETRYYLNGICVDKVSEWLYRFVATDGHRLFWVDVPLPGANGALDEKIIVPRAFLDVALARFVKAKEVIRLSFGGIAPTNQRGKTLDTSKGGSPRFALSADLGKLRFTLTTKLIDGNYPDYTRVIPTDATHVTRVKRRDLIQAIKALTPIATEKTRAVKLHFSEGKVRLSLRSPDNGDAGFEIASEGHAATIEIGFNGQYLLDCANSLTGDEVEFQMTDAGAATKIIDPADTAFGTVLMPMRV